MNAALKQITPEYQRMFWKEREGNDSHKSFIHILNILLKLFFD
jgi:hypothetical protein